MKIKFARFMKSTSTNKKICYKSTFMTLATLERLIGLRYFTKCLEITVWTHRLFSQK